MVRDFPQIGFQSFGGDYSAGDRQIHIVIEFSDTTHRVRGAFYSRGAPFGAVSERMTRLGQVADIQSERPARRADG